MKRRYSINSFYKGHLVQIFLCLMLSVFSIESIQAQDVAILGKVLSAKENTPLVGVPIIVKGTNIGVTSDANGRFQLTARAGSVLVVSYLGYTTKEVEIGSQPEITIYLEESAVQVDEVVVVGYGVQKKTNVTGSVENIKGAEIASQPVLQTSQALMGKMAGVTVLQNSSQPGADAADIRIRGIGTLSNSDPLVLIDGVPGNMNAVDTRDIAEISVLKDAASAAIYGSRAANGVVLITTKRGSTGKLRVNYNGYAGWQSPTDQPEFLGGYEYMSLYNLARANMGLSPGFQQSYIDAWQENHVTDPDQYPNTDWVKEVFSENGFQQHHSISLSGGNDIAKVMGSISYMDQNGIIANHNYKRYNARLNTDLIASKKFEFNFDLNLSRGLRQQSSSGLIYTSQAAFRVPPIYAARYTDGTWGPGWGGSNPVATIFDGGTNDGQYNNVRGIIRANYKPLTGMKISVMYSPEFSSNLGKQFDKQYEYYDYGSTSPKLYPDRNQLTQSSNLTLTNNINAVATYEKAVGSHLIKGLVGYELITSRNEWFNASRENFGLQNYQELGAGPLVNMKNDGSASEWGLQSFFGRINYDYKGKYLLEANIRRDGSSRFADGRKYGTFPAFSVGWRISEEPFFSGINFISDLKFRASWGRLGNQNIGNYPFSSTISLDQNFLFGGVPVSGAAQLQLGNKDISWETTETSNFGIDFGLLQNRISISAEYYIRNTNDILLQLPIPMIIGLTEPYQNAGKVRNKGWDLSVGWRDNINTFNYGINVNISDVQNRVTDLVGTGPHIKGNSIIQEGYPINSIYGYKSNGFFQTQADADQTKQIGAIAPGDIRYVDQNGDKTITAEDRVVIGDPYPRYMFGVSLTADFKGLDFSALVQGVGKRDVLMLRDAAFAFYNAGKIQKWHTDYWTPENLDASYPRLVATTSHNNFETSDFWVYDASYVRLRNITIGYTLPRILTEKIKAERLRLYFSGQNLFTLDNMPDGWDPEIPNGTVGGLYPITKIFTFGVDLTF